MIDKIFKNNWVLFVLSQVYFFTINFFIGQDTDYKYFIYHVLISTILFLIVDFYYSKYKLRTIYFLIFFVFPFQFFEIIKIPIKSFYDISNSIYIFILGLILIFAIFIFIFKKIKEKSHEILSLSLMLLIFTSILEIFSNYNIIKQDFNLNSRYNVIFILMDEHTSPKILEQDFNFKYDLKIDSSHLYKNLKNSKSNYTSTILSLNNLFSLGNSTPIPNIKNISKSFIEIQNNSLFNEYSKLGFKVNFHSIFNQKDTSLIDSNFIQFLKTSCISSSFYSFFINNLIVKPQLQKYFNFLNLNIFKTDQRINQSNKLIEKLRNDIDTKSSKMFFSFYHFLIPHSPYNVSYDTLNNLFYKNNNSRNTINKEQYISNIKSSNAFIEFVINEFSKSKIRENTILIIQGDHGYRGYDIEKKNMYGIYNLVYSPNQNYTMFNDSLTSVMTLKNLLLEY